MEAPEAAFWTRFEAAMDDDFNTPLALSVLFDLAREINRARDDGRQERVAVLADTLRQLGSVLGLLFRPPEDFLTGSVGDGELHAERIEALIEERARARREKDFSRADAIRDQLQADGVVLEDKPEGTLWRREG